MTTARYPAAPITSARPNRDYPGAIIVTVSCPLCRKGHVHGLPSSQPDSDGTFGHRVAHCTDRRGGYYVTDPAGQVQADPPQPSTTPPAA